MAKKETPTFEEALERLETLVKAMEHGDLALEELTERYAEGTRLVALCTEKLEAAEKRIEMVTRTAEGKPALVEFNPDAAPKTPPKDDEVSLF